MNYGETLAYWYLRLNGFFPLVDFVLHKHEETVTHSADCDILAVRHPHTYEAVGGLSSDWDQKLTELSINPVEGTVGIIVEVKTGKNTSDSRENITKSFSRARVEYAIQRLGFWPQQEARRIANELNTKSNYKEGGFQVVKLLIADDMPDSRHDSWGKLTLKDVDEFIYNRFSLYNQKFSDRHHFPSDLMQYMIWKERTLRCQRG